MANRLLSTIDPALRRSYSVYDLKGQLIEAIAGYMTPEQVTVATRAYTPNGKEAWVEDARGNRTSYAYDGFDRLATTTFPDASYETLAYDAAGQILSRRMRGGAVIAYTFDALGRPSTETMPLGGVAGGGGNLVTTTTYDLAGRTLSTSDTSGHTLTYAYDTAGRVTSNAITMPGISGARTIAYAYDAAGNRTRVTWPDAFFVDYAYDALSRMTSASENGTVTLATYAYDRLSRRVGLTYGNGATVAYGRSWAGDLLSLVHAWGSDPNNLGGGSGVTFTHSYAPDHRLASTTASGSAQAGAFEWKPGVGGATALGTDMFNPANLLNQLTQVTLSGSAARTVTWDAAGNMLSDGVLTYVHDAENRLTSVTRTTPSLNATYTYDPLGRRVRRNVNGTSTFALHDGDEEVAEYDATGALIRRFIPGPGTDEPIAIVVPASGGGAPERRYFHEDRIGNVIAMSGLASGGAAPALAEGPFTYDAYGRSPQPLGTGATSTPFRYTGRRLDAETGNYYYRARFYTPTLGQFIETDPVGYADSLNLYAYVGGDPVNSVDPSGRDAVPPFIPTWMCGDDIACQNQMIEDTMAVRQYEGAAVAALLAVIAIPIIVDAVVLNPVVATEAATVVGEFLAGDALGGASLTVAAVGAGKVISNVADAIDYTKPGKFADFSIPANGPSTYLNKADARQFEMRGTVCHTCGTSIAGTKSGKMTRDHQPPTALIESGGPQRLYPQCASCMRQQGQQVRRIVAGKKKGESEN